MGGNSTLGASGGKQGFFQNNLSALMSSAKRGNQSFGASEINFNLTADQEDLRSDLIDTSAIKQQDAMA